MSASQDRESEQLNPANLVHILSAAELAEKYRLQEIAEQEKLRAYLELCRTEGMQINGRTDGYLASLNDSNWIIRGIDLRVHGHVSSYRNPEGLRDLIPGGDVAAVHKLVRSPEFYSVTEFDRIDPFAEMRALVQYSSRLVRGLSVVELVSAEHQRLIALKK